MTRIQVAGLSFKPMGAAAIAAACIALLAQPPAHAAPAGAWTLDWSEDFSGPAVDETIWGYENGYVRNQEVQYYSNRTENSRIENGHLLIRALRDNWNGREYTSASRTTRGKKSFRYGRFEMRARIDVRQGSWPAWWWLPNSGGWPKGGEIDMMEFYQNKCLFNVMDGNKRWTAPTRSITSLGGPRWAEEFHTWTMVWDSTRIDLSLDGVLINHYPLANADGTGPNGVNPFKQPGYMILNQALGGTQGGDPSGTAFPIDFRVDWVRVHSWDPQAPAVTVTVKGGTGSGPYAAGTRASLTAGMPPVGQVFDRWVIETGTAAIDNLVSAAAALTVPAADVTVMATYKPKGVIAILRRPGRGAALVGNAAGYDIQGRKLAKRSPLSLQGGVLRLDWGASAKE